MPGYFPTDVRVRLEGTLDEGQLILGSARALLFRALLLQDRFGNGAPVHLTKRISDLAYISVTLIGDQKLVNIVTSRPAVAKPKPEAPETEEPIITSGSDIYLLCGIVKGPTFRTDEEGDTYLQYFKPTASTASSRKITGSYSENKRLGISGAGLQTTKASMFSGTMKRVVQAVQGLGRINAPGYYLTAVPASRDVDMVYSTNYGVTHGIYKAANKNHWLVEISAARGVLAMPLPLIPGTKARSYLDRLVRIGDAGTAAVVREFGGLPSGETFPAGAALTSAINDGKVLRLRTAEQLNKFYAATPNEAHTLPFSWAFSESGGRAVNTRFNYKVVDRDDPKPSLTGELWQIDITLSAHTLNPPEGSPVGTGSASLAMKSGGGRIAKSGMRNLFGSQVSEALQVILQNYVGQNCMDVDEWSTAKVLESWEGWGAPMYAFFRGETLEVVKYVPPYCWQDYRTNETRVMPYSKKFGDYPELGPFHQVFTTAGNSGSPGAVITSSMDTRKMWMTGGPFQELADFDSTYRFMGIWVGDKRVQITVPNEDLPAFLEAYNRTIGVGAYSGKAPCLPSSFAMIPAFCREGIVVGRYEYDFTGIPATMAAWGVFSQLGVISVPIIPGGVSIPQSPMFYAANINAGPQSAYLMTRGIARRGSDVGQPIQSPGYVGRNLLSDTEPATPDRMSFVGSY